jgi:hypothetical protein
LKLPLLTFRCNLGVLDIHIALVSSREGFQ